MRKIREIIRLREESGLSANRIAISLNLARSVVRECLRRIQINHRSWPLPQELDDAELENMLYPRRPAAGVRALPDWEYVHREKRKKGVTLELLWHEYQEHAEKPYSYGQFCGLYRDWKRKLNLVMRQEHKAGEKLFVDWSGKTAPVIDPATGEVKEVTRDVVETAREMMMYGLNGKLVKSGT